MRFRCVFKNKQGNFNTFEKDGMVAFPHHDCAKRIHFYKPLTIISHFDILHETERCCFFDGMEYTPEVPATYEQLSENKFISKLLVNNNFKEIGLYNGLLLLFGDDANMFITSNNSEVICGVFINGESKYDTSGYYTLKSIKNTKSEVGSEVPDSNGTTVYRKLDISVDEFIECFDNAEKFSICDISQIEKLREKRKMDRVRFIFKNRDGKFNTFNDAGKVMFTHRDSNIQPTDAVCLVKDFHTVEDRDKYLFFGGEICQLEKPSIDDIIHNSECLMLMATPQSATLYETDNMYIVASKTCNTIITKTNGRIVMYSFNNFHNSTTYDKCGYFAAFNQENKKRSKYSVEDILSISNVYLKNIDMDPINIAKLGFGALYNITAGLHYLDDLTDILFYNGVILAKFSYESRIYTLNRIGDIQTNKISQEAYRYIKDKYAAKQEIGKDAYESVMKNYFDEGFLYWPAVTVDELDDSEYIVSDKANGFLYFPLYQYNTIKADEVIYEKEFKIIQANRQHLNKLLSLAIKNKDKNYEKYQYFKMAKFPTIKK